jgi:orotate phosphoribosyltransferase-like protein
MKRTNTSTKQRQILWRRDKVLELASNGYSEREIADQLKISDTTIHRDLTLLKAQAKEQIRQYIDEKVPFEYKKTLANLEGIIKGMTKIIEDSNSDKKEIMQLQQSRCKHLHEVGTCIRR